MSEDQMLWMEQCEAAERIKEDYGIKKALRTISLIFLVWFKDPKPEHIFF